jgi:phosphohistidine phosphatase
MILRVELFLVRHGIAEEPEVAEALGRGDPERRLTEEGKEKTARIAKAFAKKIDKVSVLLHSPYHRAQETAQIFGLEFPEAEQIEVAHLRPHDSCEDAVKMLQDYIQFPSVMVVGHEPHLGGLLSLLLLGDRRLPVGFKKAGIAGLQWNPKGPAHLSFLLQPRFL